MIEPTNLQASGLTHPAAWADLAEHTGTLVALLGGMAVIIGALFIAFYKLFTRIAFTLKDDIFRMLEVMDKRLENQETVLGSCVTWEQLKPELQSITDRQLDLRQNILPRDYMRKSDMEPWSLLIKQGFDDIGKRVDAISHRLDGILGLKVERK